MRSTQALLWNEILRPHMLPVRRGHGHPELSRRFRSWLLNGGAIIDGAVGSLRDDYFVLLVDRVYVLPTPVVIQFFAVSLHSKVAQLKG